MRLDLFNKTLAVICLITIFSSCRSSFADVLFSKGRKLFDLKLGVGKNAAPFLEGEYERKGKDKRHRARVGKAYSFKVLKNGKFVFAFDNDGIAFNKRTVIVVDRDGIIEKRIVFDGLIRTEVRKDGGFRVFDSKNKKILDYNDKSDRVGEHDAPPALLKVYWFEEVKDYSTEIEFPKNDFWANSDMVYKEILDKDSKHGFKNIAEGKNRLKIERLKKYNLPLDEITCTTSYEGFVLQAWPLDIDDHGNIYILFQGYETNDENAAWTPDILEMFIDVFGKTGKELGIIHLPRHTNGAGDLGYIPSELDVFVSTSGEIYYLNRAKNTISVYQWGK